VESLTCIDVFDLDDTAFAPTHFVYKLYEATGGNPMQWAALYGIDESAATISRAVEKGDGWRAGEDRPQGGGADFDHAHWLRRSREHQGHLQDDM
jgi:hypothetical protein